MINIKAVENELIDLLTQDKKNWVHIYRLMEQVEKEHAYTTKSFTQWVNNLADKAKVHVSVLWARKKAGSVYDSYIQRATQSGKCPKPLEDVKISPDNINLVSKIAGNNSAVADELLEKVINNELHRTDLKKAWKEVKEERVAKGLSPTRQTRHDIEPIEVTNATDVISAKAILYSLENNIEWLISTIDNYKDRVDHCYKILPEFAVRTGTSHHARRIDAAVFENYSIAAGSNDLKVHGIEIKVSKNDLLNDDKMAEYADYCNYFWLAIPQALIQYAESYILDTWGILVFDEGKITCHKRAKEFDAIMREDSLIEAIKRLK